MTPSRVLRLRVVRWNLGSRKGNGNIKKISREHLLISSPFTTKSYNNHLHLHHLSLDGNNDNEDEFIFLSFTSYSHMAKLIQFLQLAHVQLPKKASGHTHKYDNPNSFETHGKKKMERLWHNDYDSNHQLSLKHWPLLSVQRVA